MDHHQPHRNLDPFAAAVIRKKATALIGRAGLTRQDRPDLEQELTLMLLERRHRYDPSKARPDAFVTMVVEHAAADIIRRLMAKKRESKRNTIQLQSLAESGHGEASQRGETISQRQQDSLRGVSPRSTEDQAQLEQDIADVLSRLSPDLRDLAERLKEQLIAQAARERGVPRSTLMHRVRQLRRRFEKAGLHHYLEPSSSTRA